MAWPWLFLRRICPRFSSQIFALLYCLPPNLLAHFFIYFSEFALYITNFCFNRLLISFYNTRQGEGYEISRVKARTESIKGVLLSARRFPGGVRAVRGRYYGNIEY
jgi:hypothetical protein